MTCPACRTDRSRPAFGGRTTFLRCQACGSLFEAEPLGAAELEAMYQDKGYFVKDDGADDAGAPWGYSDDYLAQQAFIEAKFERVLGHLERYVAPGRLLDVGCGPGFLLNVARRRGWDVAGLDLNPWATGYARDELGLDVRTGTLDADSFPGQQFDALTLMDVVEHVSDPDSLLAEAAKLVRPGGAIALLTPDAGAPVSRLLGHRWPEVKKAGEHTVLFSVEGLAATLARHGFVASGHHSVGKMAPIATLVADVSSAAPGISARLREAIADRPVGRKAVEIDPRTKFCLYARRLPDGARAPGHLPVRVPRHPEEVADVDDAVVEELRTLDTAARRSTWLFSAYAELVPGATVLEVGAGIGTFTTLLLEAGAARVCALEPNTEAAAACERRFADDERVEVLPVAVPAPAGAVPEAAFDLVVCQNVLEHIADDGEALRGMASALRPGGALVVVVPADPHLFGSLDDAYGHWRRYSAEELRDLVGAAGLVVDEVRPVNALGIVGWWLKNRRPGARIGRAAVGAHELLLGAWRPVEERLRPSAGLTLVCRATKPG